MKKKKKISAKYIKSLPQLRAPAGYIYVIQDVEVTQRFKIGRTNFPRRRLTEFGTAWAFNFDVKLVKQVTDARAAELHLHRRFKKDQKRGEWFKLDESQLEKILQWDPREIISIPLRRNIREFHSADTGSHQEYWPEGEFSETHPEDDDAYVLDEDSLDGLVQEGDVEDIITTLDSVAGMDFSGLILRDLALWGRDFSDAILWGSDLSYAVLAETNLTCADLTDSDLTGADLTGANLTSCNLTGAKLKDANLGKAILKNADFTAAELSNAKLTATIFDESTILPNGSNWTPDVDILKFTKSY